MAGGVTSGVFIGRTNGSGNVGVHGQRVSRSGDGTAAAAAAPPPPPLLLPPLFAQEQANGKKPEPATRAGYLSCVVSEVLL